MPHTLSWFPNITEKKGPIYLALADQLSDDIAAGRLTEGTKLPPQRALAWQLNVTHGTVTRAYEQAEKRKLIHAVVGKGTFVSAAREKQSPLLSPSGDMPEMDIARNTALPHLDPDLGAALAEISTKSGINALLNYTPPEGMLRHCETGREFFKLFNINCNVEEILVTSGAQHALQIILQGLFKAGDYLAVDALNYPNLISAAPRLGIKLIPIRSDDEGMCADHLKEQCSKKPIRGLFIIPNVHNPTGASTSKERLSELAKIAQHHNLTVIEDDPYSAFLKTEQNHIYSYIPEQTCTIATASKVIGGGLRTGFLAAPTKFHPALKRTIGDTSWMASPISAEITRHWLKNGVVEKTLLRKRAVLNERQKIAKSIFKTQIEIYEGRLSCWLTLPENCNPAVFELEAARRGVSLLGAHNFVVGNTPVPNACRLTLGTTPSEATLIDALTRVKTLLDEVAT